MELGVLRTLLKVAGGYTFSDYSPAASLSEHQLYGRVGSLALKRETMSFGIVERTNPRAIQKIRRLLQTDGLGVSLLILIAQARDRILFDATKGSSKNIKLAGNLYDSCQVVMTILLDFLVTDSILDGGTREIVLGKASTIYLEYLPSLTDLHTTFGLDFETTWFLCRPAAKLRHSPEEGSDEFSLVRFQLSGSACEAFSDCLPKDIFDYLTPKLLELFQMNDAYDLICPDKIYTAEKERVDKELENIQSPNPSGPKQDTEKLERLQALSNEIEKDMKNQSEHVDSILKELDDQKIYLFVSEDVSQDAARQFLTHCIYPRALLSPDDAMYSAAFAFYLHKIWTPGFSTIHFLDEMVALVSGALFGLTEGEASNVAVLLWQSWKILGKWRYEEAIFDKEVLGKPGSQVVEILGGDEKTTKSVSHLDFIKLYHKWHSMLGTSLIGCLASQEYMHIRTGLLILTRLVDVFPSRASMGSSVLDALKPLQDENTSRPDIRASANAYGMMLMKARDDGKWIDENEAEAKARADKEAAAALERKKKLEQSFQELERDNQKITAEIGSRNRFDRRRELTMPRESPQVHVGGGRLLTSRGTGNTNVRSNDFSRMETGELFHRDRNDRDYRPSREEEQRERDGRGDDRGRGKGENGDLRGDGASIREDRRWQRDAPSGRGTKRSRPSTPEGDPDSTRPRLEMENYKKRRW
jgi:THO complex subunit 2